MKRQSQPPGKRDPTNAEPDVGSSDAERDRARTERGAACIAVDLSRDVAGKRRERAARVADPSTDLHVDRLTAEIPNRPADESTAATGVDRVPHHRADVDLESDRMRREPPAPAAPDDVDRPLEAWSQARP